MRPVGVGIRKRTYLRDSREIEVVITSEQSDVGMRKRQTSLLSVNHVGNEEDGTCLSGKEHWKEGRSRLWGGFIGVGG